MKGRRLTSSKNIPRRLQNDCNPTLVLNDFSTKSTMENNGWVFSWNDEYVFRPDHYCVEVAPVSYCGFGAGDDSPVDLTLRLTGGNGIARVHFMNEADRGEVQLWRLYGDCEDTADG